jgi:hypothetical protein
MHFFDIVSKITKRNLTQVPLLFIHDFCFNIFVLKTDIKKAITHHVLCSLSTGHDEANLRYEGNRSNGKNAEMFGIKRGEYKPYSEYKKSKSNSK